MKNTNKQRAYVRQASLLSFSLPFGVGAGWDLGGVRLLLLFFISIWLLPSCSKDKDYTGRFYAEGIVFEKGKLRTPVGAGIKVRLVKYTSNGVPLGPISFSEVASTTTDANGFYRLDVVADPNASYTLAPYGDPEFFWNRFDEQIEGDQPLAEQKNVSNLIINAYGFVNVHVKNVNPVDEEDSFGLDVNGSFGTLERGKTVEKDIFGKIIANDSIRVEYSVKRTGIALFAKEGKYFAKSKDTLKININY